MALETQYSLLQWNAPGTSPKTFGVILFDPSSDTLRWRFVEDWTAITSDPDDQEYLSLWSADIAGQVAEMGPEGFLKQLEDSLSNAVGITDRTAIAVDNPDSALGDLFRRYAVLPTSRQVSSSKR